MTDKEREYRKETVFSSPIVSPKEGQGISKSWVKGQGGRKTGFLKNQQTEPKGGRANTKILVMILTNTAFIVYRKCFFKK